MNQDNKQLTPDEAAAALAIATRISGDLAPLLKTEDELPEPPESE